MNFKKLTHEDTSNLEKFLSKYAATTMFLHSNLKASGLNYNGDTYQGEYFASFDSANIINAVIVHYWNGNIMMQGESIDVLSPLIDFFQPFITRPIAGIMGVDDQARYVVQKLGLLGLDFALNHADILYGLDLDTLTIPHINDCQLKKVTPDVIDVSLLRHWMKAYNREALGSVDDNALDEKVESTVQDMLTHKPAWVLTVKGKPVSLSAFNAYLPDIVQIGPVYTPPTYRGQGYARTVVALTLQQARTNGVKKAILFTGNPLASRAYTAIGFKEIGLYRLALLKQPFIYA